MKDSNKNTKDRSGKVTKSILAVLAASLLYGIMPVFVKELLREGMSSECIVAWRFGTALMICAVIVWAKGYPVKISPKQAVTSAAAGILGFGLTASLLAASYSSISVGLATMLHFSYPLFVLLYECVIEHKKIGALRMISVIFIASGLVLMIDLSASSENVWKGTLCALLSGVSYAYYVLTNRKSSLAQMNSFSSMLYILLFGSAFFIGKAMIRDSFFPPPTLRSWVLAVSLGFFCTVLALYLLIYGIRSLGASNAALLNVAEPLTSLLAGMIVYQDALDWKTGSGCILVITAVALISINGTSANQNKKERVANDS